MAARRYRGAEAAAGDALGGVIAEGMMACCEKFQEIVGALRADGRPPTEGAYLTEAGWNLNGCCGGGCDVLQGMRFCPFCATALPLDVPATAKA